MSMRPSALDALWAALLSASVTAWVALFVSLSLGRTAPMTMSRSWLAAFVGTEAAAILWCALLGLTLQRWLRLASGTTLARVSAACTPLLLSAPSLAAIYLSDTAFHFLTTNSIPRDLVLWVPAAVALAGQAAVAVWTPSPM